MTGTGSKIDRLDLRDKTERGKPMDEKRAIVVIDDSKSTRRMMDDALRLMGQKPAVLLVPPAPPIAKPEEPRFRIPCTCGKMTSVYEGDDMWLCPDCRAKRAALGTAEGGEVKR
jgi:hypothetical protein